MDELMESIYKIVDTPFDRWNAKKLKEFLEEYVQKKIEQKLLEQRK